MAACVAFLTLLVGLNVAGHAAAATPVCLECHSAHYSALDNCTGCHRGDGRTARRNVAHSGLVPGHLVRYRVPNSSVAENGEEWIRNSGCRRCHAFKETGNRLAGSLDRLSGRHPVRILESLIHPVSFMPDFRFDNETASAIVNAILASQRPDNGGSADAPFAVRFTKHRGDGGKMFDRHCGGCHRILTRSFGGLGRGSAGPNLSGLFTDHYPKSFAQGEQWTPSHLKGWLANPRKSRPLARMQPIALDKSAFRQILSTFASAPQ